jgi:putative phage-type endonuclease
MATILKLEQGTPEWAAHRLSHRNASETPIVLGLSPFMTPYELWQVRTGRKVQEVTAAMKHGADSEAAARTAYEALTGHVMEPLVLVDGEYSASLDGMTLGGELIVEIKCPFKGRASSLWTEASEGRVPEHYALQVQHQLLVSGAELAHLFVFAEGSDSMLLEVRSDPSGWQEIREGWDAFMHFVKTDTPPPLAERDTLLRNDVEWQQRAAAYVAAKKLADEATSALDSARAALVGLTHHTSESGAGVSVTRFWKAGNVDYKKIPELRGMDLEPYRGAHRLETRVSISD